ncbi:hypothetical protein [Dyella acidiphila]|uniref:Secreted protein n=1 Tax=Dyella acidiphila TaxID=2775866 RepID=A0ABR9GEF8_9GAMM|nr:hypothetical protein [Dyella acidiphila]MBE1162412.1 hypothetical protein [Dyella acidiphila]
MRASRLLIGFLCGISSLMSAPLPAQTSATPHAAAGAACVDVTVNDHPALSYACLNQQLAASAQAPPGLQPQLDAVAHAPGNQQVGQFNYSTLSIRMGGNLGKSVYPQRPPAAAPPPLLGVPVPAH